MAGVPKSERQQRVQEAAHLLGLEDFLNRKPKALSGGQRQRVAMGRAIVRSPQVFLMDEPLSNLDAKLRVSTRTQIAALQTRLGVTTVYVTHDQVEAMTMGDRVAVIRQGVLQQTDEPQAVFDRPANLFVASFIGSPPMNLVQALVELRDGSVVARIGEQEVPIPAEVLSARPALARYSGRMVGLGVRPEHLRGLSERREGQQYAAVSGRIRATEALGSEVLVHLEIPASPVLTEEVREVAGDVDAAALQLLESEAREHRTVLIARLETQTRPDPGHELEVAVDLGRLHFFDLESGLAIHS
jgi:multiple sugar transport system ATP-binding protein